MRALLVDNGAVDRQEEAAGSRSILARIEADHLRSGRRRAPYEVGFFVPS
jgi:hypothetical protein